MRLKKLMLLLTVFAVLAGCAAQTWRTARGNVDLVKNGMTVDQAIALIGIPPTDTTGEMIQWRRGNAQIYTGWPTGAIQFRVANNVIVDIPEGGIFSPAAQAKVNAERKRQQELRDAELAESQRLAEERERVAAEARKAQEAKDEAQRVKEMAAELDAAEKSIIVCKDKTTCSKIFSLAQIYVQQNADQKIQVATDTIIETYNPTEGGKVGITVIKMPRAGTVEVVRITPTCKEEKYFERSCRLKRTAIYLGFKPFIEKSLSL